MVKRRVLQYYDKNFYKELPKPLQKLYLNIKALKFNENPNYYEIRKTIREFLDRPFN